MQCKEESGMVRTKCSQHSSWQVGAAGACRWLQLLIETSRKPQADRAGGWGAGGFSRRRLVDRPAIPTQTGLTRLSDTLIWYALGNGALDLLQHQEHDCVPAAVGEGWCRGTARLQIRQATHMPQVMAFSQSRAGWAPYGFPVNSSRGIGCLTERHTRSGVGRAAWRPPAQARMLPRPGPHNGPLTRPTWRPPARARMEPRPAHLPRRAKLELKPASSWGVGSSAAVFSGLGGGVRACACNRTQHGPLAIVCKPAGTFHTLARRKQGASPVNRWSASAPL